MNKQWFIFLSVIILLAFPTNFIAQDNTKNNSYYVSADYLSGFILPHHKAFDYFIKGYVKSINLSVARQTEGNKNWHKLYNFPYVGLAYNFSDFSNREQLGQAHSIYPFIVFPLFNKHKISSNLQFAAGVSWLTKHFDIHKNIYNIAIGSHLNAYLNFNVNLDINISNNFHLFTALGFTHFSNGGTQQPNKGINVIAVNAGLKYYINENVQNVDNEKFTESKFKKKNYYSIIVAGGLKTLEPARTKKYFVSSFQLNAERQISRKSRLGVGIDLFNDNSVVDYLRFKKIVEPNTKLGKTKDNYYAGAHLSYDLIFGKTSFTIQTGFYFWQKAKSFQDMYNRFGIKYRFSEHFMANLTLKTFWAAADFAEWGVGYVF